MDHWCEISCHFTPPNCPKSHCLCQENGTFSNNINTGTGPVKSVDDTSSLTITGTSSLILTTGPDGTTRVSENTGTFSSPGTFSSIEEFGNTGTFSSTEDFATTSTIDTKDNNLSTENFDNLNIFGIDTSGITDINTIFVPDDFGTINTSETTIDSIIEETTTTDSSESTISTTTSAPEFTTQAPPIIRNCRGNGAWSHLNHWCNMNCNHNPPYCPTTHCICD